MIDKMDEFLLNLSESTVYLLGDEELISLWEYVHVKHKEKQGNSVKMRNALGARNKHTHEFEKPVYLGKVGSDKEYDQAVENKFKSGEVNNYQYRTHQRNKKASIKMDKKKNYPKLEQGIKDGKFKDMDEARADLKKFHQGKEKKGYEKTAGAYDRSTRFIHLSSKTDENSRDIDDTHKGFNKAKSNYDHEMQHWRDHMYLKSRTGKQNADRLMKKSHKLPYYNRPSEINAHQAGRDSYWNDNIDRTKEYHKRLDNYIKTGKSKETVPENQK